MRVIANRKATLKWLITNDQGTPTDPAADPVPAVVVTDSAGVSVAAGAGTIVGSGLVTFELPAQALCDRLIARLTSTVDGAVRVDAGVVDIVGSRIIPDDFIADDGTLSKLSPERRDRVLASVEVGFRDIIGFPVVAEGARTGWDHGSSYGASSLGGFPTVTGLPYGMATSGGRLRIPGVNEPLTIYSFSIDGIAFGAPDLALIGAVDGTLQWMDRRGWQPGRYLMHLAHGIEFPEPDLQDVALVMARYIAKRLPSPSRKNPSLLPERTASLTTDSGLIVFARPSAEQPTGLPEVDAVLIRYRNDSPI